MDPTLQAVIAIAGAIVGVLGTVIAKLYLDLRTERAATKAEADARLADSREYTKDLLDIRAKLSQADASKISLLEHQVEILIQAEEHSPKLPRARRSRP